MKKIGLLLLFIFLIKNAYLQNDTQKVGLCLSGGGARGMAHIGLLEVIDSLNIKVDFVTGTSMGAVVGSLYSMGYSGKEIRAIFENIDWGSIFKPHDDFSKINLKEKDEYDKYILTFDFQDRKIKIPYGFIEGNALQEAFVKYLYPALSIKDFDSLPIPFKCVAADIYTGNKVVLDSGNIINAVRASMAIPLVFTPVKKDSMLLVDGGLVQNMPVDELKEMGADFVIGSYTGVIVRGKEKITSGLSLFLQTQSVLMIKKSQDQIKKTDLLVANTLPNYTTSSFKHYQEIINKGKENALEKLPQLISLAQNHQRTSPKKESKHPLKHDSLINIKSVKITPKNRVYEFEKEFALREFAFNPQKQYTITDLFDKTERLYGTGVFHKIQYDFKEHNDSLDVTLNLHATPHYKISFAARYESDNGAGIGLTYTVRNEILKNSRLTMNLNLGESFAFRLKYIKHLFSNKVWLETKGFFERNDINDFLSFNNNANIGFKRSFLLANIGINYSPRQNFLLGIHASLPITKVKSKLNAETNDNTIAYFNLNEFKNTYKSIYGILTLNKLNHKYFPTKGVFLNAKLSYQYDMVNQYNASVLDSIGGEYLQRNELVKSTYVNNFDFRFKWYFSPLKKLTVNIENVTNLNLFEQTQNTDTTSEITNYENKFVGGLYDRQEGNFINFYGMREATHFYTDLITFTGGIRYAIVPKLYLSAYANAGAFYNSNLTVISAISGGAAGVEYDSPIGPIKVYAQNNFSLKNTFLYLKIGYPF